MAMDTELALGRVTEFVHLCEASHEIQNRRLSDYSTDATWKQIDSDITNRLPIVEAIAAAVDERLALQLRTHDMAISHHNMLKASRELQGALEHQEEIARILNPGPKLAAVEMHSWVWDHAAGLWADGYHREAVRSAATAIFDFHLPSYLGVPKDTSREALCAAFKTDAPTHGQPRLRVEGFDEGSEDFRNVHQGAQNLGLSCAKLVRNLSSHTTEEHDDNEALEELAMLSRFSRLITSSRLETASAEQ